MSRLVQTRPGVVPGTYETAAPVSWEVGLKGNGQWVTIPAGFVFDVSVPWFARWFINPDDRRWFLGALVHDYLLDAGRLGRAQAAAEFFDGAVAGGAPKWRAKIAFVAVAAWAVYKPAFLD